MDHEIWKVLSDAVRSADRSVPRTGRAKSYSDRQIVRMYLWAVWHDRPMCWACSRDAYSSRFRPRVLPSVSQFSRRLRSTRVGAMIERVGARLADRGGRTRLAFLDGKALPVSESSADPDARTGRGNGRFSRGYKVHALCDSSRKIRRFWLTPMNEGEPTVARERLAPGVTPGSVVLADANYDGRKLYDAIDERGATLFTPQRRRHDTEGGMARTCVARRRAMERWRDDPEGSRKLYAQRSAVERVFSALTTFGGGLSPLPAWVRRIGRVRRWVTAKIAIYNARVEVGGAR
ncbi:MAG: transposase [Planctomycetota bacterium]